MKAFASAASLVLLFGISAPTTIAAADQLGEYARAPQGAAAGAPALFAPPAFPAVGPAGFCATDFTQSSSHDIVVQNSWACVTPTTNIHRDNSYWRAYRFDYPVTVRSVSFGVESAVTNRASQLVTVRLYANADGSFPAGTRTLVSSADVAVENQAGTIVEVPIAGSFPAGTELVVEVNTPFLGELAGFFIGSNAAAETSPGYLSAPDCSRDNPVTTTAAGFPDMHIIIDLNADVCFEAWSAPGAVGVMTSASSASVLGPVLQLKPSLTRASLTARYGIPGLALDGTQAMLRFRYRDNGPAARVRLWLMRTEITTGVEETVAAYDSNLAGALPDYQVGELVLPDLPLQAGVYWVQATLDKTAVAGKPALHSLQLLWTGAP